MENGSQPLIRLDQVSKVFVTDEVETHALAGIHFDVKKGEYLSIAGPSGCGKSTLLAILGLLDTPSDGTYYLNGKPVTGLKLTTWFPAPRPETVTPLFSQAPPSTAHCAPAVIAPAGQQMTLRRNGRSVEVHLEDDVIKSLHVPSVDVLAAAVDEVLAEPA